MINGNTKIFGVLSDPIKHVKAPEFLNDIWLKKNMNQIMIPIHVCLNNLEMTINNFRLIPNFFGFCVTIPHKIKVFEICDILLPSAQQTQAVNVAYFNENRELIGANFDGQGFVEGMINEGYVIKNKDIFMVGAGGAARGISFSLIENLCGSLTISNRTVAKAIELEKLIKKWYPNFDIRIKDFPDNPDIIINSTSLGLNINDKLPLEKTFLSHNVIVAEIIMEPELTPLLEVCVKNGIRIHKGKHMFSNQINLIDNFLTERKILT